MQRTIKLFVFALIFIGLLTGCDAQSLQNSNDVPDKLIPSPSPIARDIDYVEIQRNPDEYDGEFIRVAGQITNFSSTDRHSFYFNDRLGLDEDSIGFEINLKHTPGSQKANEIYKIGDFVVVEGTWQTGYFSKLKDAVVTHTGDDAEKKAMEYLNVWKDERIAFSNSNPILNYMNVIKNIENFDNQYIRIVGLISSTGTNKVTYHLYFRFRDINTNYAILGISLKGCPQEMQDSCREGEYVILSGKITADGSGADFSDCYIECVGEKAKEAYDAVMSGQSFAPPTQQVNQNGQYIASVESDKYHRLSCRWAEKILPTNAIYFDNINEARAAGYTPCGTCNP